jgi:hypothetical protein
MEEAEGAGGGGGVETGFVLGRALEGMLYWEMSWEEA